MKKTKIVCTIGPASNSSDTIIDMINSGMNVARLNFSHGTHEKHKETIDLIKSIRKTERKPVAIMLDTKGPEIRIKKIKDGQVTLEDDQEFTLTNKEILGNEKIVSITYEHLFEEVNKGNTILLDDGKIMLEVTDVKNDDIICNIKVGGILKDHKGVNVPNLKLNMQYMSKEDEKDIIFGIENDVDFIAASFARRSSDMEALRQYLDENGGKNIKIIAKIENMEGVDNYEELLKISDGIMVARGDMGVEIEYEKLPGIQKRLIKSANAVGKICITATQMLESMITNHMPTRAEITDVANAVYDGTSAVMLSGESAMGEYPVEAVKAMNNITIQAENDKESMVQSFTRRQTVDKMILDEDITNSVGNAACMLAKDISANAIIAITKSGYTASMMAKFRPNVKIIAVTPYEKVYHQLSLVWGAIPVITKTKEELGELLNECINACVNEKLLTPGDRIVLSAGLPLNVSGTTNMIRVKTVE